MLKQDRKAHFVQVGVFSKKYRLYGTGEVSPTYILTQYQEILDKQLVNPVEVLRAADSGRCWWMYRDAFYWEDEHLTVAEVEALLLERARKRRQRIDRAVAAAQSQKELVAEPNSGFRRQAIPDDVKMYVWQRDGGHCVKCGSQANLEFDHIIPISKGGSNTARNVQLLCEACNRSKYTSIV